MPAAASCADLSAWQALDELLVFASELGMRLILSLSDYVGSLGTGKAGIEPYLMWLKGSVNITGRHWLMGP